MKHIGDPHHEIREACRARGWLDLRVASWDRELIRSQDDWISHPKGYFQPGVLVVNKDGRVLYRWQQNNRSGANAGGALHRPTADYVWSQIHAGLSSPQDRDAAFDLEPDTHDDAIPWPFRKSQRMPYSLAVAMLVANGWFFRPKMLADPSHPEATQMAVIARIPAFVALWGVAFYSLPLWLAGGLLLGWIAWITPGVRLINRNFLGE